MTPPPLRIASLVPSLTELAVDLGLGDVLVARTGFCIHPAQALRSVPKVGGTKDVNLAKLQGLAPSHVLVNVDENRLATVEAIQRWNPAPEVVVTHPRGPEDNLDLLATMGRLFGHHLGVPENASRLRRSLREELALTQPPGQPRRRVLYLIWRDPWMTVARDTYIAAMLARVGWLTWPDVAGGEAGATRYPALTGEEPWLADLDEVLLSTEPYRFGPEHFDEARRLCPGAGVRLVDGEMLSWYGSRAVAGLRYLREIAAPHGG